MTRPLFLLLKLNIMEFGSKVKDQITGFEGIVTGRASYITGCDQYLVMPVVGKDGSAKDGKWFDEGRIIKTGKGFDPRKVLAKEKGADMEAPLK